VSLPLRRGRERAFVLDLRTPAWVPAAIGALTLGAVYHGARRRPRDTWLGVATVLSLAVALFADELSLAYIPGHLVPLWNPGVSLSRPGCRVVMVRCYIGRCRTVGPMRYYDNQLYALGVAGD
jgi:hypothetical protein